ARILGRTTTVSVTFRTQRHLQIAELTVKARMQTIAACGEADTQESALRAALAHAEQQALRHRDRKITRKRLPKEEKVLEAPPVSRPKAARAVNLEAALENGRANQSAAKPRAEIAVHSFPAPTAVVEPHILKAADAIALRPMTVEEAVKEAEFR